MTLAQLILIASGLRATVYGLGEGNCGDPGHAVPCAKGAVTASGEEFDPNIPSAAIAAPFDLVLRAQDIGLQVEGGPCVRIRLNDKSNERWIGERGFDLTPAAVELLTGERPSPYWSGKVFVCPLDGRPDSSFYPWLQRWPSDS